MEVYICDTELYIRIYLLTRGYQVNGVTCHGKLSLVWFAAMRCVCRLGLVLWVSQMWCVCSCGCRAGK